MISRLDHLVLTVEDIPRSVAFYTKALGMRSVSFGEGRIALSFGQQKINLHQNGREFDPKASRPTPGSADLCFIADIPLEEAIQYRVLYLGGYLLMPEVKPQTLAPLFAAVQQAGVRACRPIRRSRSGRASS